MTARTPSPYMSKKDAGWRHILLQEGLLEEIKANGVARITAATMNAVWPQVDARLMAKFDTLASRPAILREHGLSIWPEANGSYAIVQSEDPYIVFDPKKIKALPERFLNARDIGFDLATLNTDTMSTETQALAVLKTSRVIHALHGAHDDRLALTDGGRNRLQKAPQRFAFATPQGPVALTSVEVQIEPDAVHESDHLVTVTEAKMLRGSKGLAGIASLHARQIALPHGHYRAMLGGSANDKPVETGALYVWKQSAKHPWRFVWLPIAIVQDTTTRFEVAWERAAIFTLLEHRREGLRRYQHRRPANDLSQVEKGRPTSDAPFPQFNRFNVIEHIAYDLGRLGAGRLISELTVAQHQKMRRSQGFTLTKAQQAMLQAVDIDDLIEKFSYGYAWGPRNESYLVQALRWLGLVESYDPVTRMITPSALCVYLASVDPDVRTQRLWNIVVSSPVMAAIAQGQPVDGDARAADGLLNDATAQRRVSTAKGWIADLQARMRSTPHIAYAI